MRVLHIALAPDWAAAEAVGEYQVSTRGRTLQQEGFIHCSTSRQVGATLAAFYGDVDPCGLQLLVIDVPALEASGTALRWDDVPGAAEPFPHAYGPIKITAVAAVLPIGTNAAVSASSPIRAAGEGPGLPDLSGWDVAAGAPHRA